MSHAPQKGISYLLLCLLLTAAIGCRRTPPPPPPPPPPPGVCGVLRWDVKTLSDPNIANLINPAQTVPTRIRPLVKRRQPNPWANNLPRQINFDAAGKPAVEKTVWIVQEVELVRFRQLPDRDIHLIVREGRRGPVLNIEFPDVTCNGAKDSPFKTQMAAARRALVQECGNAPNSYKTLKGKATISGVGFFDKEHGQPSTIELHPALSFTIVEACK